MNTFEEDKSKIKQNEFILKLSNIAFDMVQVTRLDVIKSTGYICVLIEKRCFESTDCRLCLGNSHSPSYTAQCPRNNFLLVKPSGQTKQGLMPPFSLNVPSSHLSQLLEKPLGA